MKLKRMTMTVLAGLVCLSLLGCAAGNKDGAHKKDAKAKAGWKPKGQVSFIVPSTPGGGHDTAARIFAKCVQKVTGVKMNIVNNGAGGGAVAFAEIMNAKPNGMTIGQLGIGLVSDQYTIDGCTYKPDSYRYIGIPTGDDCYLVVSTKGKFKDMNLKQFIEHSKKNPVTLACSGTWGQSDTSRYLLEKASGTKFTRVGIKGGSNCALAVVAGDVDSTMAFPAEVSAQVKAGNLKILGFLGEKRNNFFKDAPTFKEQGYDINVPSFKVIALPKNTPDDIYNGWLEIFKQTMADPQTAKEFEAANIQPQNFAGDDAYKYIMKTHDFMKAIIDTGIMKKK